MLRTLSLDFTLTHTNCPDKHPQANAPEFETIKTVIDKSVHEGIHARCTLCRTEVLLEFGDIVDGPTPV